MALWLVDLEAVPLALAGSVLSAEEQARASRFRFETHARRYQASHVALRQILGGVTQLDPSSLTFTEGSQGKPRLSLAHPTVHFNMSHSEGWALIGLSHLGPIGVDIELLAPMDDADLLAQRNFSATEYAAYLQTPAAQRLEAFFRCWTRKEACLKALGSGLSIEPHEFEAGLDRLPRDTFIQVDGHPCAMSVCCVDLPIPGLAAAAHLADPHSPLAM
jgi:4'-phosphopantetheinyl transferase